MSAHSELYLHTEIYLDRSEYYISFNNGYRSYKITDSFLNTLKENKLIVE